MVPYLSDFFQHRQKIFHAGNLFLMDQQVGVFVDALHPFRIGDKIGREITTVKTHAFNKIESGFQTFVV